MEPKTRLGIDFGTRRIGVAIADCVTEVVRPLCVVTRQGGQRDLDVLVRLVREQDAREIVMGLPLHMNGSEGEMAKKARAFAERLRVALGQAGLQIDIVFSDERLSSWEAEGMLRESGLRPAKRRQVVDQVAAALLLKDYLRDLEDQANGDPVEPSTGAERPDHEPE